MAKAVMDPVEVSGRGLVSNWWGRAWIENLETYADEDRRISRGRAYLREGNVLDLKIDKGVVKGVVAGSRSSPYKVDVRIEPVSESVACDVQSRCSVRLSDAEQLMEGRMPLSMEDAMKSPGGLFPCRSDIAFTCTCPDDAEMCKHVAAVLLGVGVRFDSDPSLFFKLRGISMDLFAERTLKGRLDIMLDNADVRTGRMLDDSMIGSLFGVVEHMEHKRRPMEMDMLVKLLGRPLYEEGSLLAGSGCVSEAEDLGDGMLKISVSEPKAARQHVVIWRDRDGNPSRYGCGCDSEGVCRHISAALVKTFGQDAVEYEVRKEREAARISMRIEGLETWGDEDGMLDEILDICDDIVETFGFDDLRTVRLIDDLFAAICVENDPILYPKVAVLSDLVCSMSPEDMAGLLGDDRKSWLFTFSSEIPRRTIEALYGMGPEDVGKENRAELAFLLGRYDEYIGEDRRDCTRLLRCVYSASNCGREDEASRFAGMLAFSDVPYDRRTEVESVLKRFGIGGISSAVGIEDFIRDPSSRTLRVLEKSNSVPRHILLRECWDEILVRRVPSAFEMRFFAQNGASDPVGEFLFTEESEKLLGRDCDSAELGWLFNIFVDGSKYAYAADLGRRLAYRLMKDYKKYPMVRQLLAAMEHDHGFEGLPEPHSEFMARFRKDFNGRWKFWRDYDSFRSGLDLR